MSGFKSRAFLAATMVAAFATAANAAPPDYYPADYSKIIEASKTEGPLLVQSNVGEVNWRPILEAFKQEYPWIQVQTLDLGGTEVFERYFAEAAAGSSKADIVLSATGAVWNDFIKKGNVVEYASPEIGHLPAWSLPRPSVYTISVDPYVTVYNKKLLTPAEYPNSMSDIAALVAKNPGKYTRRIATIRPFSSSSNELQLSMFIAHMGLDKFLANSAVLGPIADLERSGGPIFEKITTGEFILGWQLSAIQMVPLLRDPARASIIGYALPKDGLVTSMRLFSIAKTVKNPNEAKLLVDFLLSKKGQEAVAAGGLVPYRPGIEVHDDVYGLTYDKIVAAIGEKNIIRTSINDLDKVAPPDLQAKVLDAFHVTN